MSTARKQFKKDKNTDDKAVPTGFSTSLRVGNYETHFFENKHSRVSRKLFLVSAYTSCLCRNIFAPKLKYPIKTVISSWFFEFFSKKEELAVLLDIHN